jgi:hypothetical protein
MKEFENFDPTSKNECRVETFELNIETFKHLQMIAPFGKTLHLNALFYSQ